MAAAGRAGSGQRGHIEARVRAIVGVQPRAGPATEPPTPGTHRAAARLDPGRSGALAIAIVALVAGAITLLWVLAARPHAAPIEPSGSGFPSAPVRQSGASAPAVSSSASHATEVVVDVAGKVRRPGLYRLPAGSRVDDAVRAAGGALPGVSLTTLNLAARLADGQQVAVGVAAAPAAASGSATSTGPIDLNTASLEQLDGLPGVGPVLAQHILDWRSAHGRFGTVAQLDQVPGIGTAKFQTLRPLVTV